jgi:hypothetical protein
VLPRAPSAAAVTGLIMGVPLYAVFNLLAGVAYLNAAALSFLVTSALMLVITWWRPLVEPRLLPDAGVVALEPAPWARAMGLILVAATGVLYVMFW